MAQHFLLSPHARTLTLTKVLRMSDREAEKAFRAVRWPETNGEPVCPVCGGTHHYHLKKRAVWKCKSCGKQFSLTSGTIFHSRKLALRDILGAIAIFTNGAKGYSALQLARDLGCDYKSCFVLLHKLRESIALARDAGALSGDVEIDGAYFGGYVKPTNNVEDRKDRRKKENQSGRRQSVVVMRERDGRTVTGVAAREADGVEMARQTICHDATVHADEASHWDQLAANFPIKRVNHQVQYSAPDGACTNQAESFFSRMRRSEIGIHHKIAGPYLGSYATELAWREDVRRVSNGNQFTMIVTAAATAPKSAAWCGYWQRRS